jgi:DNA-binding Lrp family transcriptional regulator
MIPFDSLDYLIIRELHQNARISATDIARKLNVNERTVRNRINHLTEDGAVRLTAIVNPHKFGYVTAADILLEVETDSEKDVISNLVSMPQITYLALGQGSKDFSIEGRFKDNAEMLDFIHHVLPAISGVKVKGYALVPRIIRNIDEWMPKATDFIQKSID